MSAAPDPKGSPDSGGPPTRPPQPADLGPSRDDGYAHLRAAALEAERSTGARERTEEQARRGVLARLAIISLGSLVTLLGLVLIPLPGPGIVVVLAGLGILATEVAWAERALAYAKRRSKVDALTAQAPWLKPASVVVTIIGTAASLLYAFRWRS